MNHNPVRHTTFTSSSRPRTTWGAPPISHAFADYAPHSHSLRRFALHVAYVVAERIDTRIWSLPTTGGVAPPESWRRSPILYLMDCPHFLGAAGEIFHMLRDTAEDVTHEVLDIAHLVLDQFKADKYNQYTYEHLVSWLDSTENWSDEEYLRFLNQVLPNNVL